MILKNTIFYVLILALIQFCHILDFVIIMPLGPILIKSLNINAKDFSVLVSSYSFTAAPAALVVGVFIDRFDRKQFSLFMLLGFVITTFLCGYVDSYYSLLIMRVLSGAFGGILSVSILAMLSDLVPEEDRGKATSTVIAAFSIASIAGIPLGLLIAKAYSYKFTFYFIALIALLACFAVFYILPGLPPKNTLLDDGRIKRYLKLMNHKKYWPAFLLPSFASFASYLIIPFLSTFLFLNLGFNESDLSLIFFIAGMGTMISLKAVGYLSDRYGARNIYYIVALISFIPLLLFTHTKSRVLLEVIGLSAAFQMFVAGRFIPCISIITKVPLESERGAFMSIMHALRSFFSGLAALSAGWIVSTDIDGKLINFEQTAYFSIAVTVFSFIIIYFVQKNLEENQ